MDVKTYIATIEKLEQKSEYMNYEINSPVHIDDYLNIDTNNKLNPTLYQIVVPLVQDFYYKGKHYRFTDEHYRRIGGPKGCVKITEKFGDDALCEGSRFVDSASNGLKEGYNPIVFNLQEIKGNIINIRWYNITKIDSLKRAYVETVEHYLAMGNDFVVELTD